MTAFVELATVLDEAELDELMARFGEPRRAKAVPLHAKVHRYGDAALLEALRQWAHDLDRAPTVAAYENWRLGRGLASSSPLIRRYGSWAAALAAAGVKRQ